MVGRRNSSGQFIKGSTPWNKKVKVNPLVKCACGCGEKLKKYDNRWRVRKSLPNHLLKSNRSGFKKGHKTWNKGTRGLQKAWNKGLTKREDSRLGIPPWTGKKRDKETIKKISKAKKGVGLSEEHKEKLSKIAKEKGFGKWMKNKYGKDKYVKMGLKGLIKQQNMKEPTSIEKKVYAELKTKGLLFETQKLINGKFIVDAYIPKLNLIIECDGDYWHSLDRVKKKDKAENAYLKKCGYNLIRLSEKEINNDNFKERIGV